jgi:hypothetical protein
VLLVPERFMKVATSVSAAVIHEHVAVRNILGWPRGGRMLTKTLFVEILPPELRFQLCQLLSSMVLFDHFIQYVIRRMMMWVPCASV